MPQQNSLFWKPKDTIFFYTLDFRQLSTYQRLFTCNESNQTPLPFKCALHYKDVDTTFLQ